MILSVKKQWRSFFVFFITAFLAIIFLKPLDEGYEYSNGKALMAWFIPLPVSLCYFLINIYTGRNVKESGWVSLLLFVLLWLPFLNDLSNSYLYLPQDDGARYRLVATNIVERGTLQAGDGLIFGTSDKTYMIQPGYRYYLALWIRIFGQEIRLYQVVNMLLYLLAVMCLFTKSSLLSHHTNFRSALMAFILLSAPFVVKLIMLGLSEWLAITIFIAAMCFYISRLIIPAIILLALLPFIRQNLIVVSVLMLMWIVIKENRKWWLIVLFLAILLLPLYHNLYYAGKWQFFSVYDDPSTFMVLEFEGSPIGSMISNILFHMSLYSGINWRLDNIPANVLSLLFIPLGTYWMIRSVFLLNQHQRRWYLAIVCAAIIPTLIFGGTAYYPRFEWVNVSIALASFIVLRSKLNGSPLQSGNVSC